MTRESRPNRATASRPRETAVCEHPVSHVSGRNRARPASAIPADRWKKPTRTRATTALYPPQFMSVMLSCSTVAVETQTK